MSAATVFAIGWLMLSPTAAPVPADTPPDPLGRGYLGASFSREGPSNDLEVSTVEPNKPAAKAGTQVGDIIVRVGTVTPANFKELVAHITSYRPGAVVEVEVTRGGERKIVQVTLTERPLSADRGSSPTPIPDIPEDK